MSIEKRINTRLHLVDALRGFAIVSIMLLHNIEHFDVYFTPQNLPVWMLGLDKVIWDTLFFLFGGKSYAIFALLFGLTYHIQSTNQKARGKSFDGRFAWRLVLLFLFGMLNSAFFQGDILTIYAALGFLLIPLGKLGEKALFWIALVLLLLPFEWFNLYTAIQNPNMAMSNPVSWSYFGRMMEYIPGSSMMDTLIGNLTNGKIAVLLWNKENGRFFLILSYFLFGILAGRNNVFAINDKSKRFWIKTLIVSGIVFIPFYILRLYLPDLVESDAILRSLGLFISTGANTAFMVILVAGFSLLFHFATFQKKLRYFSPFGKMSLSNYVFQSIVGATLYYGFGFGLYQYTGATYGLIIGIAFTIVFGILCAWWAKKYARGPLETLWHKANWIKFNTSKS